MKEILKYLRTVNGFSQEQVAQKIGLSRQSYNKYEAGTVIPSGKILQKLAELYKVDASFIEENKIPALPGAKRVEHGSKVQTDSEQKNLHPKEVNYVLKENFGDLKVASPAVACEALELEEKITSRKTRTYDAYFSENSIRLVAYDVPYKEGQRLRITVEEESEEEETRRKTEAWERLQTYIGKLKLPPELEGLSEKEIMHKAWEEKYGK